MRPRSFFILTFLLALSCEERIELALPSEDTGLLVVEGVLTNERKNHLVRLSFPYAEPGGEAKPATGASVVVFEDTTAFPLTEFPAGSGNYYTPVGRAVAGKKYTLFIRYEGKEYRAEDSQVPVQPLSALQYRSTDHGYALNFNKTGDDPYYIEYDISWRNTAACSGACDGRVVFYDLKTIDVNEIYKPDKAPFYFPAGSVVIRRKYSVSPEYRSFLRSMLSETEWRGGVFDVERSNVATNLSKGAAGFFAVCSMVSDTTIVR